MIRHIVTLALVLTATTPTHAQPMIADLSQFRWENRPVLAFGPEDGDAQVEEQARTLLSKRDCAASRDIVLIEIVGSHVRVAGKPDPAFDPDALRAKYQVARGQSAFLLIGKDGGVKMRRDTPITSDMLFGTIDAMPMRRREALEQARNSDRADPAC